MKRDRQLLKRAQQWDEEALAEIYDTFAPRIYRYAYRHLGHRTTAQDVTSETFQRLLDALKNGGGPHTNLSADALRRVPPPEPEAWEAARDAYLSEARTLAAEAETSELPERRQG